MSVRRVLGGAAVVAVYLVVAAATFRSGFLPVRPIYEGTAPPQPYQWVDPPPEAAAQNEPPQSGSEIVDLSSQATTVRTGDGQALALPRAGTLVAAPGETQVRMSLRPLDPDTVGPPPEGFRYDGNAYEITAVYVSSGQPAQTAATSCPSQGETTCTTVLLRYPVGATEIFRRDGSAWTKLESRVFPSAMQLAADTPRYGVFVAAHPAGASGSRSNVIGFALGITAIVVGTLVARLRVRRENRRAQTGAKQSVKKPAKQAPRKPPPKKSTAKKKMRSVKRWLKS